MEFKSDGTIVLDLARKRYVDPTEESDGHWVMTDEFEEVTLRRPVLEELFELWTGIDEMSHADVEGAAELDDAAQQGLAKATVKTAIVNLRRNALWIRSAIYTLGPPGIYTQERDENEVVTDYKLRSDLAEPAWFSSATAAGQMLRHWQEIPLARGSAPTPLR